MNAAPETEPHILIQDLTMAYGDFVIQRDLDFAIHRGDIFIVMGPSGCGKSTLLKCMIGLKAPAKGRIVLEGESFWDTEPEAREGIAIGIGPVELPGYLDRPQVVTRSSANKLELAEFDHWGGRLKDDFTRVLAEHLSSALSTDRVSVHPWRASVPVDYQVTIRVTAFENDRVDDSLLDVRWNVIDANTKKVLAMARSSYREKVGPEGGGPEGITGYEAVAAAMSRNVADLGRDIAAKIKSLSGQ